MLDTVPGIPSERLELVWMSPAFMLASLEGQRELAGELLAGHLPTDWPTLHARQVMQRRLRQIADLPEEAPWLLRAILRREDREMVGYINFHGRPNEAGQAELGYTVFESHRRHGFATEAVRAMMGWAETEHGVGRVLLSIAPGNLPSLALASRLGFRQIGSQIDEIDGEEHIFELVRPNP